jgi:hypothetical protein
MRKAHCTRSSPKPKKASNQEKSRYHTRVGNVIGFMTNSMKGMYIKSIGYCKGNRKNQVDRPDLQSDALRTAQQKSLCRFSMKMNPL